MLTFVLAITINYIVIYFIIRTTSYWNKCLIFGNFSTYKIDHLITETGITDLLSSLMLNKPYWEGEANKAKQVKYSKAG